MWRPIIESRPAPLVVVLDTAAFSSDSVSPSPPPRRLNDDHDNTFNARFTNMGASVLFSRVSPVFPSRPAQGTRLDRKSTRLNSSHVAISYAVFCLKKKKEYIATREC